MSRHRLLLRHIGHKTAKYNNEDIRRRHQTCKIKLHKRRHTQKHNETVKHNKDITSKNKQTQQMHQRDAYPANAGGVTSMCNTPTPFSRATYPSLILHASTRSFHASTGGIENDVAVRLPNITWASNSLDVWPRDLWGQMFTPLSRGRFMPIYIKIGLFVFEVQRSQLGNRRTNEQTDRRTDKGTGPEHYASGQSWLAHR